MKGRGLLIALVVSLALNLFLVGLGAGALLFGAKHRGGEAAQTHRPRGGALWKAGHGLSPEHRPAYRKVLRDALQATRADLAEARRLKGRAFDAMASDRYDAAQVAADLGASRALEFKARSRLEKDITAFAATLPPDERAALAESLRATMTRLVTNRFQQNWKGKGRPREERP